MAVTAANLFPLYIQRISDCLNIKDRSLRRKTWTTLAEPVSVLLELSEDEDLLDSVLSKEEFKVFRELVKSNLHDRNVTYPVARPESAKLSEYASVATLPSMPWSPRSQGSATVKRPDNKRCLQSVQKIPSAEFFGRVLSYQEARRPSDTNQFPKNLRVPHDDYPFVQSAGCLCPLSEEHVVSWVHQVALQTAQSLLHNTEAETKGWNFGKATSRQGLSDVVFKSVSKSKGAQSEVKRLLVEVKCPWTLPLTEMEEITKLQCGLPTLWELEALDGVSRPSSSFDSLKRGKKLGYTPAQRVLAQVFDYCQEQKHHFFIITTYEYWMFGVFSLDYTSASVTEPLPYNLQGPTILQCIIYWLQSSLFLPGSFEIPEISASLYGYEPFGPHTTGAMWRRALRTWRLNTIKELQLDRNLSKDTKTRNLVEMCCSSLRKLGYSQTERAAREAHLLARCREVVDQIQPRPTTPGEWTVILTWLAMILDPITLDDGLQTLEEAFVIAADLDPEHPILEDQAHRKRKSLVDSRRARGESGGILQPNDPWHGDGTLRESYWRCASKEVVIILDRYLPEKIRRKLQRWNLRAPLTCGPRDSNIEPQDSRHLTEQRPPENMRLRCLPIPEVSRQVAVWKSLPFRPPNPKPRTTVGTPAERRAHAEDRRL